MSEDTWPFGMAIFPNNIVEILNRFLKQAFDVHTAWGGGQQKTGKVPVDAPRPLWTHMPRPWGKCCNGLFYTKTMLFTMFLVFPGLP